MQKSIRRLVSGSTFSDILKSCYQKIGVDRKYKESIGRLIKCSHCTNADGGRCQEIVSFCIVKCQKAKGIDEFNKAAAKSLVMLHFLVYHQSLHIPGGGHGKNIGIINTFYEYLSSQLCNMAINRDLDALNAASDETPSEVYLCLSISRYLQLLVNIYCSCPIATIHSECDKAIQYFESLMTGKEGSIVREDRNIDNMDFNPRVFINSYLYKERHELLKEEMTPEIVDRLLDRLCNTNVSPVPLTNLCIIFDELLFRALQHQTHAESLYRLARMAESSTHYTSLALILLEWEATLRMMLLCMLTIVLPFRSERLLFLSGDPPLFYWHKQPTIWAAATAAYTPGVSTHLLSVFFGRWNAALENVTGQMASIKSDHLPNQTIVDDRRDTVKIVDILINGVPKAVPEQLLRLRRTIGENDYRARFSHAITSLSLDRPVVLNNIHELDRMRNFILQMNKVDRSTGIFQDDVLRIFGQHATLQITSPTIDYDVDIYYVLPLYLGANLQDVQFVPLDQLLLTLTQAPKSFPVDEDTIRNVQTYNTKYERTPPVYEHKKIVRKGSTKEPVSPFNGLFRKLIEPCIMQKPRPEPMTLRDLGLGNAALFHSAVEAEIEQEVKKQQRPHFQRASSPRQLPIPSKTSPSKSTPTKPTPNHAKPCKQTPTPFHGLKNEESTPATRTPTVSTPQRKNCAGIPSRTPPPSPHQPGTPPSAGNTTPKRNNILAAKNTTPGAKSIPSRSNNLPISRGETYAAGARIPKSKGNLPARPPQLSKGRVGDMPYPPIPTPPTGYRSRSPSPDTPRQRRIGSP